MSEFICHSTTQVFGLGNRLGTACKAGIMLIRGPCFLVSFKHYKFHPNLQVAPATQCWENLVQNNHSAKNVPEGLPWSTSQFLSDSFTDGAGELIAVRCCAHTESSAPFQSGMDHRGVLQGLNEHLKQHWLLWEDYRMHTRHCQGRPDSLTDTPGE